MAPSKPKAPPTPSLPTSTKDPPEALLWAYQLRREHGYLLSKIDAVNSSNKGLDLEHKKLAVSNLELWASNQELSASLKTVTEQNMRFENRLQVIETAIQGLSNKVVDLKAAGSNAMETLDDLWEAVREEGAVRGLLKTSLDSVHVDYKTNKEGRTRDIEVLRGMFGDLTSKVRDLERRGRARASEGRKEHAVFEGESIGSLSSLLPRLLYTANNTPLTSLPAPTLRQSQILTAASTPLPLPQPQRRPDAKMQPKPRSEAQVEPKSKSEAQSPPRPGPRLRKPRRVAPPYPTLPTQQLATYVEQSSLFQPEPPISHTDILNGIRQGDLDLESYLKETEPKIEMLKRSSKPADAEQRVVYAFLRGLERNNIRGGIYMQLQSTDFAWSDLERIVRTEGKMKENPPEKELPPLPPKPAKENAPDRGYTKHDEDTTLDIAAQEILDAAAEETLMEKRERTRLWMEQRRPRETRKGNEGPSMERKRRRDMLPEILGPDSGVQTRARTKTALTRFR